jgi:hypothetical protein
MTSNQTAETVHGSEHDREAVKYFIGHADTDATWAMLKAHCYRSPQYGSACKAKPPTRFGAGGHLGPFVQQSWSDSAYFRKAASIPFFFSASVFEPVSTP